MKLSVVIVTRERHQDLIECLNSIFKSPPAFSFEVIVVFNGPSDYVDVCEKNESIKILKLPHHIFPGTARNESFKLVRGDYVLFLDDDCILPPHYFEQIFLNETWDVLGGPDQSPPDSNTLQKDIGHCLSSPFCMGPTRKRHSRISGYKTDAGERDLILCNLLFKTRIFKEENFKFNDHLIRNEENFLIKELADNQKIIHYNPDLYVYHKRKEDWTRLGKAVESSGYHRVINFLMKPKLTEIFYIAPLIFVMTLSALALFSPRLFITIEFFYVAAIAFYFLNQHRKINTNIILIHHFIILKYSIGLLSGLLNFQIIFKENKSLIKESKIR